MLAGSQNLVSSTTYNNFSAGWQPQVVTLGSGDSDTSTFDPNTGRITQYKATINGSSATGSLTWNQNGSLRQLQIADQFTPANSQTCTYTHDDLARIGQVDCGSGKWGQAFTFDAFGNVTKAVISGHTGTSFAPTYTAGTNQLGCTGCSYDSNGNLKADGPSGVGNTYAWDAEGNLSQFNGGTALVYDALGRRVEQTNASGTNEILYGPDGSKLALMSGTAVAKAFVPLPGGATAVYSGATLGWYRHPDWLGSSRIASTPSRTVSYDGTASYSPFGESPTETGDHNFTGQNQDLVPNFLYDFPAREYHPGESRWLSPDPAGMAAADPSNPQSWNRYGYVNNSPLDSVDPLGLDNDCGGPCTPFTFQAGPNCTVSVTYEKYTDPLGNRWDMPIFALTCSANGGGGGGGNQGGGGGGGLVQSKNLCSSTTGTTSIISGNATTNIPTIAAGGVIGEAIGGPPAGFVGAIIGSLFGIGGTVSYVPSTKSLYVGPTIVFAPALGGGSGFSGSRVSVPAGQDPNSIANGLSYSITFQPRPLLGSTVVKSPGNPPVVGPSVGTRIPISFGASFNLPVIKGGCQ